MYLNDIEKRILITLFKSTHGLDAFTLYRRTRTPFPDYSKSIRALEDRKYISVTSNFIRITKEGRDITSFFKIDYREIKSWREVPESMRGIKISADALYIPSKKRLDKLFTKPN